MVRRPDHQGLGYINTLVKYAAILVGMEKGLKCEVLDRVGDSLVVKPPTELRATIWQAVWALSGDAPEEMKWKDPWKAHFDWLPLSTDPEVRFYFLYKKLVGYASLLCYGDAAAAKVGVKPAQQQQFRNLALAINKVYRSILVLSQWRNDRRPPYICAAKIAAIWA